MDPHSKFCQKRIIRGTTSWNIATISRSAGNYTSIFASNRTSLVRKTNGNTHISIEWMKIHENVLKINENSEIVEKYVYITTFQDGSTLVVFQKRIPRGTISWNIALSWWLYINICIKPNIVGTWNQWKYTYFDRVHENSEQCTKIQQKRINCRQIH